MLHSVVATRATWSSSDIVRLNEIFIPDLFFRCITVTRLPSGLGKDPFDGKEQPESGGGGGRKLLIGPKRDRAVYQVNEIIDRQIKFTRNKLVRTKVARASAIYIVKPAASLNTNDNIKGSISGADQSVSIISPCCPE